MEQPAYFAVTMQMVEGTIYVGPTSNGLFGIGMVFRFGTLLYMIATNGGLRAIDAVIMPRNWQLLAAAA